jgi:hypothetical protein
MSTAHYGSLLSMLTSPSEESQIRHGKEGNQTIDLDTGSIETTDFDPNPVKVLLSGTAAYYKVKAFFEGK